MMEFRLGLECLNREDLKGNISMVTNSTGVTTSLEQNVDWLRSKDVMVREIFAPEHGFYTAFKNGEDVPDETYNGIPVTSIYSENRKPFSKDRLEGVDTVIYDLQDAGSRPYTHLSILKELLKATKDAGIRLIVCDRPAPLSGSRVEGPMIEKENLSFVGIDQIPLRYGMTIGEVAIFMNQKIGADLKVSKMSGYSRDGYYDKYMKFYVPPSLNLSCLDSVINFSGLVLLEATKASIGRGTPYPFLEFGFSKHFQFPTSKINGAKLRKTMFVPTLDPLRDAMVKGYFIHIYDRDKYSSIELVIEAMKELSKVDPDFVDFKHMAKLYGSLKIKRYIENEVSTDEIRTEWKDENRDYMEQRTNCFLYN